MTVEQHPLPARCMTCREPLVLIHLRWVETKTQQPHKCKRKKP